MAKNEASGFTLIELLITVAVIGILAIALAPVLSQYIGASRRNYNEQAKVDNQKLAGGLLAYARNAGNGRLPAPYSGGELTSALYNPTDASAGGLALRQAMADSGVRPTAVNDDGTSGRKARVYQYLSGLNHQVPLYGRSGPLVTLTYDYGVVYLSGCPVGAGSCAVGGKPGPSPVLSSANRNAWVPVPPDHGAAFVSSLPLQAAMLQTTARRVDRVRDALTAYYRGKQIAAEPTDTTNWLPGAALAGKAPSGNQGCRDGWYALSTANILPVIGLSRDEFGFTPWGGGIEYCADYDPLGAKSPNAPPHVGAIRFRANVSLGSSPDPSVVSNNVVLTL